MTASGTTLKVRMWALKVLKDRKRKYGVRWITAGEEHSEWYEYRPQAENRRTDLILAMRKGEEFDIETGLPVSELKARDGLTLLESAQGFIDRIWKAAPASTRRHTVDCLANSVGGFVRDLDNAPAWPLLRRVLTTRLLPSNTRDLPMTLEMKAAALWVSRASRPIVELSSRTEVKKLLASYPMTTLVSGEAASADFMQKKRRVLHRLLVDEVDSEVLDVNPLAGLIGRVALGDDVVAVEVDPRTVVNVRQGRQLLAAVTYVTDPRSRDRGRRLYAFFACMYYGALRPGEALGLHEEDCVLPEDGWGELVLCRSFSGSNKRYTNNGEAHENRSLKRRPRKEVRRVPIPSELVAILREHLDTFGTASDGRLFAGSKSGLGVGASVYTNVWKAARVIGLTPSQEKSNLARRPYDLRHAAVSTQLSAGVDPVSVAARAGQTVAILLKIYAKCLDGNRDAINRKIDNVLRDED